MQEKWLAALLSSDKKVKVVVAVGLAGMVLILLSTLLPQKSSGKQTLPIASSADTAAYAEQLEQRLERIIGQIQGVGECNVLVTLSGGSEYIYATEEKSTTKRSEDSAESNRSVNEQDTGEQQYIILQTDDGEQALLITEIAPRIGGVVVACTGGGNETVANQVVKAVTVALDIPSTKVCVTTRQSK